MKIIAHTTSSYLVEMDEDEIARAAGYSGSYDNKWRSVRCKSAYSDRLIVGTTVNVNAAYDWHSRIALHSNECKAAATTLRMLADMMSGAMPEVITAPPKEEKSDEDN